VDVLSFSALLLPTLAISAVLPAPTGPFAVGRVTVEWVDRSRIEPLSPDHGYRVLMVDIWYPADSSAGASAPYLDASAFERAIGAPGLRRQLGGAYEAVREGRVQTHAVAGAPFSRSIARAPVLAFSPGGGLVRETDRRIIACLNQDGLAGKRPFRLEAGGWGTNQRFMLMQRASESGPPPDEELAAMKITRERAMGLLARLDSDHDAALQSVRGGSYEVVLNTSITTHMDFTDLPILGAPTQADSDLHARVLSVVRTWTLAFFDQSLRAKRASLLDQPAGGDVVQSVRRFNLRRP